MANPIPNHSTVPPLLQVQELSKYFVLSVPWLSGIFGRQSPPILRAVDGVSFEIQRGQTFALVGESGCGKSTAARVIVGLYHPTTGKIFFQGKSLGDPSVKSSPESHTRMQMIFQDPYASLDPRWRVQDIIAEPIRAFHLAKNRTELRERVSELLLQVGLSPSDGEKYPHEFSGGQRQRISIARALSSHPDFLVCDEPTSALDVSVQAQILNLMKELQRRLGLTYLFISHNLAVVNHISDYVGVMYLGRLCEVAPKRILFNQPQHPYTRLLLDTIPDLSISGRRRQPVTGEVPNPIHPPSGCAFHPRCPSAYDRCRIEKPNPKFAKDNLVACHAVEEGLLQ
ncbi:MAG: ATP-binding cassette domain-containing protein [Proteobacteria bacterium]|nr:ATP-binding cassette domain-containing protein [Pseudomonadota bacterium]